MKKKKEYIGAHEASKIMHIGYRRFMKELMEGHIDLPFSRPGFKYFFRRKDVVEYFENSFKRVNHDE